MARGGVKQKGKTMKLNIREPKNDIEMYIEPIELDCDVHHLAKKFRDTADLLDRLGEATLKKEPFIVETFCVKLPWEAEPLSISIRKTWESEDGENNCLNRAWLSQGRKIQKKGDGAAITTITLPTDTNPKNYEKLTVAEAVEKENEKVLQQFKEYFDSEE
jgi:hypothetical protein